MQMRCKVYNSLKITILEQIKSNNIWSVKRVEINLMIKEP
jgi:hypothetical protein